MLLKLFILSLFLFAADKPESECIYDYSLLEPSVRLSESEYAKQLAKKTKELGHPIPFSDLTSFTGRKKFYESTLHNWNLSQPDRIKLLEWTIANEPDGSLLGRTLIDLGYEDRPRAAALAKALLNSTHPKVAHNALMYLLTQHDSQIPELCHQLIHTSKDPKVIAAAIRGLKNPESIPQLKKLLHHPDHSIQMNAVEILFDIGGYEAFDKNEKTRAVLENLNRTVPNEIARRILVLQFGDARYHSLYNNVRKQGDVAVSKFFDKRTAVEPVEFAKTGSKLFLLSGPLAGKVVAHIVKKTSAEAWRKALASDWKSEGYDYVPVEPIHTREEVIQQFGLRKASVTALDKLKENVKPDEELVFSGVIMGPNLLKAERGTQIANFTGEVDKLKATLKKFNIDHGHATSANTVLQKDGNKTRPYLIDWDNAKAN